MDNRNRKHLLCQVKDQHKLLLHLLTKIKTRCDKKSTHKIRVQLKAWQAFYDFCSPAINTKANAIQFPKKWEKLFRQSGKLREIQVTTGLLHELKLEEEMKNELEKLFENEKIKRKKKILFLIKHMKPESGNLELRPFRSLWKKPSEKLQPLLKLFFENHFLNVFKTQFKQKRYYNLHSKRTHLRKIIQLIYFWGAIKKFQQQVPFFETINYTAIQLGKWHDRYVMKKLIHKFLDKKGFKIRSTKKIQLKKITAEIESIYNQQSQHLLHELMKKDLKTAANEFQNYLFHY